MSNGIPNFPVTLPAKSVVGRLASTAGPAEAVPLDRIEADIIASQAFTQIGTGAVPRSYPSKMQDIVSVKDFGAIGDGVTDDTAAIQAFLDYVTSNHLEGDFIAGDYVVGASLTITNKTHFKALGRSSTGGSNNSGRYGIRFLLNGANGGTIFALSGTRDYALGNFGIIPKSASNTIGVGLDIDGANSTLG